MTKADLTADYSAEKYEFLGVCVCQMFYMNKIFYISNNLFGTKHQNPKESSWLAHIRATEPGRGAGCHKHVH